MKAAVDVIGGKDAWAGPCKASSSSMIIFHSVPVAPGYKTTWRYKFSHLESTRIKIHQKSQNYHDYLHVSLDKTRAK